MAKSMIKELESWHTTRLGFLVFGIIELALAYGFASLAINYASFWQYALAVILLIGGLRNLIRIFWKPKNDRHK